MCALGWYLFGGLLLLVLWAVIWLVRTPDDDPISHTGSSSVVTRSRKTNQKVQASLNMPCPKCGFSISPADKARSDAA
jgi:hypothetical protein